MALFINPEDLTYVMDILNHNDLETPLTITFWMDNDNAFIGTSVTYERKKRVWIQAEPEHIQHCANSLELLEQIYPLEGLYCAYMREYVASSTRWLFVGSGTYNHSETVLYYNGKKLHECYRNQMMVLKGYKEAT